MKSKGIFLELGRWMCAALAVVLLIGMFGGNAVSDAKAEDVAQAVTETLDMENLLLADNQMIKRFYGLDPASFESCILYYPVSNMMAEEILIVKLSDLSQQEAVRAAMEARVDTQKNTFEGYGVEQYEMLSKNTVILIKGNYALLAVNKDSAKAEKAFLDAL